MAIRLVSTGSYAKTEAYLARLTSGDLYSDLDRYGQEGVNALSKATPRETGNTASSWEYRVTRSRGFASIEWYNTNEAGGSNVAIMLQYGHGTGTGGYVSGRDYINPAIQPIFDKIAEEVWKKVNNG